MHRPLVVIAGISDTAADIAADVLTRAGWRIAVARPAEPDTIAAAGAGAAALIVGAARVDAALLDRLPGLGLVVRTALGSVDAVAAEQRGVWVAGPQPGAVADRHARQALSMVLAQVRQAGHGRSVEWGTVSRPRDLTLGLIGLGRVGARVAGLAAPLFARVVGTDPYTAHRPDGVERLELAELLAVSDVISLHVPLNAETEGLIDAESIAEMRDGTIVVNLADNSLVERDALLTALHGGRIAGFGSSPARAHEPHAAEPCALRAHPSVRYSPDRPLARAGRHAEGPIRLALNVVTWNDRGVPLDPVPRSERWPVP